MSASSTGATLTLLLFTISNVITSDGIVNTVSNRLIPTLFKHIEGTKEDNVVFSSIALVQNLAVVSTLTNDSLVAADIVRVLALENEQQILTLKQGLRDILLKFEVEANEGENTTEATGLFNYIHVNPEHKLREDLTDTLASELRTNLTYDTSLEGGSFTASSDTGVLSAWREREALAVFTLLQHSAEAPFFLNNGTVRSVPLVPHVGFLGTRQHPNFTLVRLPLQAASANLVLLLPHSPEEFGYLVDAMPADVTDLTDPGEHRQEVALWIPQMLAISSLELRPVLAKLGAENLFKADFQSATKSKETLLLSRISQKSFFSTSFTSVKSITESEANFGVDSRREKRQVESKSIVFNKPFLFFIERADLKLILTSGCINDPTQYPMQA